jgi:hypothetical protein
MNLCPICGKPARYFTDTYDPGEAKPVCIYLCREHQQMIVDTIRETIVEEAQG